LFASASASRPKFAFRNSTALRRTSGFTESGSFSAFGVRAPSTSTGMTRILRASAAAILATFKPSRRFLGCHGVRRHLQQLGHERIGTLALALKGEAASIRNSRKSTIGEADITNIDPEAARAGAEQKRWEKLKERLETDLRNAGR
jgi:hypothetical protein